MLDRIGGEIIKLFVLVLIAIVSLFPLYWMVTTAFQAQALIIRTPPAMFPVSPTLTNFCQLLEGQPWKEWTANTIAVTAGATVLSVVVSSLAGYAFSTWRGKGMSAIFWSFMASLMITRYALMIPAFVVLRRLHLSGQVAVVATAIFSPYGIYVFKVFCDGIPRSYIESARLDGASEPLIVARIMAPLCAPAIGALIVAKGVETLQDYVWESLVLQRPDQMTLLVGLIRSANDSLTRMNFIDNYGMQAAAGVLLFAPLFAVFCVASRYFIRGIGEGGEKA